MNSPVIYADIEKIKAAGERYVAEGAQDKGMKAERQRDVDGALVFLQSAAAEKLRPAGLQPKDAPLEKPARTVLDAMGASRG